VEVNALNPSLGALALNNSVEAADAASDELLALRARQQYRESGIPALAADEFVAPLLDHEERLLGSRDPATVRMVDIDDGGRAIRLEEGRLYVTDRRLLHVGSRTESVELLNIDELAMADDRILVTLAGSRGLTLDVENPHQLRVLIAAAKAARRSHGEG
jgi:hypothetical protein